MRLLSPFWVLAIFLVWRGAQGEDCNGNIIDDSDDLETGYSRDCNANGVPDECDLLPMYRFSQFLPFQAQRPLSIATADLDGDGAAEVVTANAESDNISLLGNDGRGGLALTHYLTAGDGPGQIQSGDLDQDGDNDIVAANVESSDISIFLGDGGVLVPKIPVSTGSRPFRLVLIDLTNDGLLDVATAGTKEVTILRGTGGGDFARLPEVTLDSEVNPVAMAAGDIESDGDLDLLAVTSEKGIQGSIGYEPATLWAIPNLGGGGLGEPLDRVFGMTPRNIVADDLDDDGMIDIAAAMGGKRSVSILWGAGDWAFEEPVDLNLGKIVEHIQAVDLDQDGDLDIGVSGSVGFQGGFSGLINEGSRSIMERMSIASIKAFSVGNLDGEGPPDVAGIDQNLRSVVAVLGLRHGSLDGTRVSLDVEADHVIDADFNGDGHPDLATSSPTARTFSLLLNDGSGGLPVAAHFSAIGTPASLTSGDIDGDGQIDIVLPDETDPSVHVHSNEGSGQFRHALKVPLDLPPSRVTPWDFDLDGDLDLACACPWRYAVLLLRNEGEAGFQVEVVKELLARPQSVLAADFNLDGSQELALDGHDDLSVFDWAPGEGLKELGRSYFPTPVLEAADVDGDGRVDVVGGHGYGLSIRRNLGNWSFDRGLILGWAASNGSVAIADLEGDGTLELSGVDTTNRRLFTLHKTTMASSLDLDANGAPDECDLARGDCNDNGVLDVEDVAAGQAMDCNENLIPDECDLRPSIGLSPAFEFGVGGSPYGLDAADLNGDGHIDVATANTSSDEVSVLLSDRSLTFFPARSYLIAGSIPGQFGSANPRAIVAGDFDGDGGMDLCVANSGRYSISQLGGSITMLWNQGNGTFLPAPYVPLGGSPVGVAAADLDGDFDLDIIVPHDSVGGVSILHNEQGREFATPVHHAVPTPDALEVGDADGDGDQDVLFHSRISGAFFLMKNRGDGEFDAPEATPLPDGRYYAFGSADVDGDLSLDVMVAIESYIHVYLNEGNEGFVSQEERLFAVQPMALEGSDLDGDGQVDLVATQSTGSIAVRPNLGSGVFGPAKEFNCGRHPLWIATTDVDGVDGMDVLVSVGEGESNTDDTVAVLLNTSGWSRDCNANEVPDECDIAGGILNDANGDGFAEECLHRLRFGTGPAPPTAFHRGDVTGEGSFDITDPISLLNVLFVDGRRLSCREAADFDNDGQINITDAIAGLGYLFLGGEPPAPPGPSGMACGIDPDLQGSPRDLGCDSYEGCS